MWKKAFRGKTVFPRPFTSASPLDKVTYFRAHILKKKQTKPIYFYKANYIYNAYTYIQVFIYSILYIFTYNVLYRHMYIYIYAIYMFIYIYIYIYIMNNPHSCTFVNLICEVIFKFAAVTKIQSHIIKNMKQVISAFCQALSEPIFKACESCRFGINTAHLTKKKHNYWQFYVKKVF